MPVPEEASRDFEIVLCGNLMGARYNFLAMSSLYFSRPESASTSTWPRSGA
jgi:hypothetical protein